MLHALTRAILTAVIFSHFFCSRKSDAHLTLRCYCFAVYCEGVCEISTHRKTFEVLNFVPTLFFFVVVMLTSRGPCKAPSSAATPVSLPEGRPYKKPPHKIHYSCHFALASVRAMSVHSSHYKTRRRVSRATRQPTQYNGPTRILDCTSAAQTHKCFGVSVT